MVQTFSAVGNMGAGFISLGFVALLANGVISSDWRWIFSVGIVPSLLSVIVIRRLREPEAVAIARPPREGGEEGGLRRAFRRARWRRSAIVGMLLAASGVMGLWGIGVFSNDLTQRFVGNQYDLAQIAADEAVKDLRFVGLAIQSRREHRTCKARGAAEQLSGFLPQDKGTQRLYNGAGSFRRRDGDAGERTGRLKRAMNPSRHPGWRISGPQCGGECWQRDRRITSRGSSRGRRPASTWCCTWAAWTLITFNFGAFFGMYVFARVTQWLGRRPTFAIFFLLAMFITAFVFRYMAKMPQDLWMVPLMGAAQLSVFGGYAIYFPELFPTRLRSTGASFCYNVGRYVSAIGPLSLAFLVPYLVSKLTKLGIDDPNQASRYAGMAMCACYLIGLVALLFAPETKGQPLPE